MSLDVYLIQKGVQNLPSEPKIFIRESGQTKEISREEWDKRFPNREPTTVELPNDDEYLFEANITHNLGKMANKAGIYNYLWRPDEIGISRASQLVEPLSKGLKLMKSEPKRFKKFDAKNGWGIYDDFIPWIEKYIEACKKYPNAEIEVSR